ncbi:MAG: hypothetical protein GY842_09600 [bacterium]|nr:hypothetical protein [bacterium]
MFERFSDRARKVMALANQEAQGLKHEYIGTEHILLGMLHEGMGVGADMLRDFGVDPAKARVELEAIIRPGTVEGTVGRLPQHQRVKNVIEHAVEEARGLGHHYVGTEHVLLGLLREEGSLAAQVLAKLNLNVQDVRAKVGDLLAMPEGFSGSTPGAASSAGDRRNHPLVRRLLTILERHESLLDQAIQASDQHKAAGLNESMQELERHLEKMSRALED